MRPWPTAATVMWSPWMFAEVSTPRAWLTDVTDTTPGKAAGYRGPSFAVGAEPRSPALATTSAPLAVAYDTALGERGVRRLDAHRDVDDLGAEIDGRADPLGEPRSGRGEVLEPVVREPLRRGDPEDLYGHQRGVTGQPDLAGTVDRSAGQQAGDRRPMPGEVVAAGRVRRPALDGRQQGPPRPHRGVGR